MPYQTFTTARATEPDRTALVDALRVLDATAGVQHAPGTPTFVIKKNTAWTAPQIAAAQTVIDTAPETTPTMRYTRTSREKDILSTLAMIVRAKNLAAWNAMTVQQKKDATFAEADVWVTIRDFVENNL
jgi:DNA-binding FadR family transcriptional regulator